MAGGENLCIGDAERDEAIVLLRGYMNAGWVIAERFDERVPATFTVETQEEFTILFNDLSGYAPGDPYTAYTPIPIQPATE